MDGCARRRVANPAFLRVSLALALALLPGRDGLAESAGGLTLTSLLRQFADLPGLEARFREEKRIALLEAPLVSSGTLHFVPPAKLARWITSPSPSTVIIEGGLLRFHDGRRASELDLDANPLVRHFVESFVHLLAGDEDALRRLYDPALSPRPQEGARAWEMVLSPRPRAMRRVLREVRLTGEGVVIEEMSVREVSGDETTTTFSNVNAARRYSQAELRRIFSLPAP